MSVKLSIDLPDLSNEERTYITTDYSSGTSLVVRSNNGATTNYYVVVGEPGQERTETQAISGTSGDTTITLSLALKWGHPSGTPVYITKWNKLAIESATSSTGTFSAITESPVDLDWDSHTLTTVVINVAGSTSHYFKWRYSNSTTSEYSSYSGVLAGTGSARDTAGFVLEEIYKNPDFKQVSNDTIFTFMTDFQDLVQDKIPTAWWFSKTGTDVSTAADDYDYAISSNWSDLVFIDYVLFRYISGDVESIYPLKFKDNLEFYNLKADQDQASNDSVKYWTFLPPNSSSALGYIGLHPTPATDDCYIRPIYRYKLSSIDSFDDTLVIPLPKAYVDYVSYRIYDQILRDKENADTYNLRTDTNLGALRRRAKRQLGQPEFLKYRGQRGWSRLFGSGGIMSSSDYVENYW